MIKMIIEESKTTQFFPKTNQSGYETKICCNNMVVMPSVVYMCTTLIIKWLLD